MIKLLKGEKFKEIKTEGKLQLRYAISNLGRLASYQNKLADGQLLNASNIEGYRIFRYRLYKGKKVNHRHLFLHRLVADYFIPNRSSSKSYVLHLDYNKGNNQIRNLRWASKTEMQEHHKKNPKVLAAIKKRKNTPVLEGHKLNVAKVRKIKERLFSKTKKYTLRQIANEFRISDMQVHRIKTGENWKHVKVSR